MKKIAMAILLVGCICLLSGCVTHYVNLPCAEVKERYGIQLKEASGRTDEWAWFHKGKYAAYVQLWEEFCR